MVKQFVFASPEQLKALCAASLCKEGDVMKFAQVWSIALRRNGNTPWEGKVGISFSSVGRMRKAVVYRIGPEGNMREMAQLKYAPALAWCNEQLKLLVNTNTGGCENGTTQETEA